MTLVMMFSLNVGAAAEMRHFRLFTQPLNIPERGEVTSYVLLNSTNKYIFLPPPEWQVKADSAAQKVTLMPRDLKASITVTFTTNRSLSNPQKEREACRQAVLKRQSETKILEEFPCYTSGAEGWAFDLEQTVQRRTKLTTRLAFVPLAGNLVEFQLTANSKMFTNYTFAFANLMTSFRLEPWKADH